MPTLTKPDRAAVRDALAYMKGEHERPTPKMWSPEYEAQLAEFHEHERTLIRAGICPSCASAAEPMTSHLLKWEPGDHWNHAGRRCPNCEEFFVCGEQPEYEPDPWMGDADPGL